MEEKTENPKFGSIDEITAYLSAKRKEKYDTLKNLACELNRIGLRRSTVYQGVCEFERGIFYNIPRSGNRYKLFHAYCTTIGISIQEREAILLTCQQEREKELAERKRERLETTRKSTGSFGEEALSDRENRKVREYDPDELVPSHYNLLHGRPSKWINTRSRKGGGLILGEDLRTGKDWLRTALTHHNGPEELSLDEVVNFSLTFVGMYNQHSDQLAQALTSLEENRESRERLKKYLVEGEGNDYIILCQPLLMITGTFRANDLREEAPKHHISCQTDKAAEALDTKLAMLKLDGYVTAQYFRAKVSESREKYFSLINKARQTMRDLVAT